MDLARSQENNDAINNGGGNGTNDSDVRGVANDDGSAAWLLKICIQI